MFHPNAKYTMPPMISPRFNLEFALYFVIHEGPLFSTHVPDWQSMHRSKGRSEFAFLSYCGLVSGLSTL